MLYPNRSALTLAASLVFASLAFAQTPPPPSSVLMVDATGHFVEPNSANPAPNQAQLFLYSPDQVKISKTPAAYTPAQIRHAYGIDQISASGTGQIIAIVEAYGSPTAQSDLNTFDTTFSLPATTLQIVNPSETTTYDADWALETSLDIQWIHAVAPNATIIISVAPTSGQTDLANAVTAATNAGANVVSMSWGEPEFSNESTYESLFQVAGVSFTASAGDFGAETLWPAASPSVTGVGGTTLKLNSTYGRQSEIAWSGSGGGFSTYFSRPVFQNSWQSNAQRSIPDVSFEGDPNTGVSVYDTAGGSGGWMTVGGTSLGAPAWAALISLSNQQAHASPTGVNTNLYTLAATTTAKKVPTPLLQSATYFYDVKSGSDPSGSGVNTAGPGLDQITGLGSPVVNNLMPAAR